MLCRSSHQHCWSKRGSERPKATSTRAGALARGNWIPNAPPARERSYQRNAGTLTVYGLEVSCRVSIWWCRPANPSRNPVQTRLEDAGRRTTAHSKLPQVLVPQGLSRNEKRHREGWRCRIWRGWRGSNPRPLASEANTLSTELQPHLQSAAIIARGLQATCALQGLRRSGRYNARLIPVNPCPASGGAIHQRMS